MLTYATSAGLMRYRARVDAKRPAHTEDESDVGSVRAVISIHPIMKIQNALPERVSMSLLAANVQDRVETALVTRSMGPGDTVYLYYADSKSALGLIMQTSALKEVRHPALIFHPGGEKVCSDMLTKPM